MPKREARVDLEQEQSPIGRALEIELGDAAQVHAPHQIAAEGRDIACVGEFEGTAMTARDRIGADLAAGELGRHLAARIDVDMVALDAALGPRDAFLHQIAAATRGEPRPQRLQSRGIVDAQRLVGTGEFVPRPRSADWLDDGGPGGVSSGTRRLHRRLDDAGGRNGQAQATGEIGKPPLVDEVLDQFRGSDHEAEDRAEGLAMARDHQQLRIVLVEKDRTLRLRPPKRNEGVYELPALVASLVEKHDLARETRERGRVAGLGDDDARNAGQPQGANKIHVAEDAGERRSR